VIQKRTSEYSPRAAITLKDFEEKKMANAFVHNELNTTDVGKAKAFYSKLFDWKLEDMAGGMEYTLIKVGENTAGGIMQHPVPGAPSMWLSYVNVDDIKASTAKAKSLGATLVRDVTEIPNVGWFSIFTDPTGAMLALFQAKMQ
jgi:predicted enzyme related to lactoylglutathione lyase